MTATRYGGAHGVVPEILATGASRGDFASVLEGAGYPVHHLHNDKRPGFALALLRLLREQQVELVHQHTERTGFWLSAICAAAGCKVVRVVHNHYAFSGHLRWRRAVQRGLLHCLGVEFVAISEGVQRNERDRFGLPTHLVWNWADVQRYRAPSSPERESCARALGVREGRFRRRQRRQLLSGQESRPLDRGPGAMPRPCAAALPARGDRRGHG